MAGTHSILVVDDEKIQTNILGEILSHEGFNVTTRNDPEEALNLIKSQSHDLVITDLKMPKIDGVAFTQQARKFSPELIVIIMTAFGTVETAVKAMREGAFDYITKPFPKEELILTVQRAIKSIDILRENVYLKEKLGLKEDSNFFIGNTDEIQRISQMAKKIAMDDKATILIQGETGTGKNVLSKTIHQLSTRKTHPFIIVNCPAIPEGLLESEFFGHEKGAFTGAVSSKPGRFELADKGTLFLDEIGELNPTVQGKLLRVLETQEFERVGGTRTLRVNVRVIAATNKNLQQEVKNHRFREDLYYRLNIFPITLPPLRERKEDIPFLAEHFLTIFHLEGKPLIKLSSEALGILMKYHYPGNVRELENILERAVILSDQKFITPREIQIQPFFQETPLQNLPVPTPKKLSLVEIGRMAAEEAEKGIILKTLKETNWNRLQAAKVLGIDYKTLRTKIRRYGISAREEKIPNQ